MRSIATVGVYWTTG